MRNLQSAICNCLGCRMDFTIRPATIDDYTAIDTIFVEVELLHRAALPQIFRAPERPILLPRRYAEVNNLAVHAPYRQSGVGRALLKRAEQWAAEQQLGEIELNVWEFNQGAIEFYEKLGYVTERRTMWRNISDANS